MLSNLIFIYYIIILLMINKIIIYVDSENWTIHVKIR